MKKWSFWMVYATLLIFSVSCDKSDQEDLPDEKPKANIEVSSTEFIFPSAGGTGELTISSNSTWTINFKFTDWCAPSIQTSKGNANVVLMAQPNSSEEARNLTLTVTALNTDTIISILCEQEGKEKDTIPDEPVAEDYIEPDITGMDSDAKTLASKMYLGWNLGNSLEATGGETAWGNPRTSNELILAVKEAGFNAIRIPCAWDQYLEDQTSYKIKDFWMARVKEVVDYCVENDMYAILNIHWDGGWMENNNTPEKQEEVSEKLAAIWKQIALSFRDYDERLLFAGANEPNAENQAQADVLAAHMQTFVNTVRGTGGKNSYRNLIVQAPFTDIDRADNFMTMPTDTVDNRLFAEVHYYTPWQFCGLTEDANWGKMYYFWGDPYHIEGAEERYPDWDCEEDYVNAQFKKMKTKFVDNGIPLILGEFGALRRTLNESALWQQKHDESRAYFFETVTRESKNHGMVPFFWDNGSGIFDRSTNTINAQGDYNGLINGATNGAYPF